MKTVLLYGSSHGRTRKVVADAVSRLRFPVDVQDVKELKSPAGLKAYGLWVVFCPTYGDEELQPDIEAFLGSLEPDLKGVQFTICELGNYYGYDDFAFGALQIIRLELEKRGANLWSTPLSLDSLPKIPWEQLYRWVESLNRRYEGL